MGDYFVAELPLMATLTDKHKLDRLFRCCNVMKNNLISYYTNQLKQLARTTAWKEVQQNIRELYPKAGTDKEIDVQLKDSYKIKNALLKKYGFSQNDFQKRMKTYRKPYEKIVHSHVAQNISDDVWGAFEKYFFGNGKEVHFSPIDEFCTVSGKNNITGIYYYDGKVYIGQYKKKFSISVNFSKDKYLYETQAFRNEICLCKINRRMYPSGWTYLLQICFKGTPPVKVDPDTGELLHPIGKGSVGHDIGPQTLASVGNNKVSLVMLASDVDNIDKQLCRINRAMDRSRRATNPDMFDKDGVVVPKNKLPNELVNRFGNRVWKKSKRYKQLEQTHRYLYTLKKIQTIQAHQELANKLIAYGNQHYIEKMNWQALAKKAKETKTTKTGKYASKKRFGKSILNKSPASFIKVLQHTLSKQNGSLTEINTWAAKASQFDHTDKAFKKKHLSQRWAHLSNGDQIQRDLYSAFLIQNINKELNGFDQTMLEEKYICFKEMHDDCIQHIKETAIKTPSSFGFSAA